MNIANSVTSIQATGSVDADYDQAYFQISLNSTGASVPKAKELLKKKTDVLLSLLESIKSEHEVNVVEHSLKTGVYISPNYVWNEKKLDNELKGYIATYRLSFKTDTMDKVSVVYDELTSLKEATVNNPSYLLKDAEGLNKAAVKKAWDTIQSRFADECAVLAKNPEDFEIAAWQVHYNNDRNTNYAMASASAVRTAKSAVRVDSPIELASGQATVNVNLTVTYRTKG